MYIKIPNQKDTCYLVPQLCANQRKDIKGAILQDSKEVIELNYEQSQFSVSQDKKAILSCCDLEHLISGVHQKKN